MVSICGLREPWDNVFLAAEISFWMVLNNYGGKSFYRKKLFLKFSRVDGHSAKQTPFVWSKWVYLTSGCYFFLYKAAGRLGRLMLLSDYEPEYPQTGRHNWGCQPGELSSYLFAHHTGRWKILHFLVSNWLLCYYCFISIFSLFI